MKQKGVYTNKNQAKVCSLLSGGSDKEAYVTFGRLEPYAALDNALEVGHADPRTTKRYWRTKQNLDDNAVDYVRL